MSAKLTVGELVYKISGDMENLKSELKKSEAEVTKLKESMENTEKKTSSFGESLKKLAAGLGLVYLAKLAVDFGKASVQAYANAQQSLIQFNNAQENVAGTTKEQINGLNEYILALEKKTTVDDKTIRQGAQILAQDQIAIENQKKLLKGIVDIAVANSGANGGNVDVTGTARAVGRVVATGDAGILTRQNIIVDPKTAKALKDTNDETERANILMKILEENGKGAGDALGKSFQGSLNRAKDTVEDLQVAVGKGLTTAFSVFTAGLGDTLGGIKGVEGGSNKLGTAFVYVAGLANFVINTFKLMGISLYQTGVGLVGLAKVSFGFGKDVIGIFKQVGEAINSIGEAMVNVLTGDFKEAKDALKKGFDFSGAFDNSSKALEEAATASGKVSDQFNQTTQDIKANVETMANAKQVYADVTAENDKLTTAKDSLNKKIKKEAELTDEAKANIEKLRDKVFDLRKNIDELVVSLGEKLVDATKKFTDSLKSTVTDSAKSLVDITVNAEKEIEDLKKKISEQQGKEGSDVSDLQAQLKEKQRILKSQAEFEAGLNAFVADSKKRADEAALALTTEVDPGKKALLEATTEGLNLQIEALKGFSNLEAQIKEARKLAGEDEFKQAQINSFAKIELATQEFITETAKLREKQAIAIEIEKSITAFYKSETALRQKTLDEFAVTSIATLRRIGAEAKSALAAINAARSAGAQISNPVINPLSTSNVSTPSQSNSNSTTNNNKNVNAPITVNATIKDSTDPAQIARDLAWRLSHL